MANVSRPAAAAARTVSSGSMTIVFEVGALDARALRSRAAVSSVPARRARVERAAAEAHISVLLSRAHASSVLILSARRVVALLACVAVGCAGAAAQAVIAGAAQKIGARVAGEAVARGRALALAVEVVGAGDIGAGPRLRLGQTTWTPEAVGAAGARHERRVVVSAGITKRGDREDRAPGAGVGGAARQARCRTRFILVSAPRAFGALRAARGVGVCALAALSWRHPATRAPAPSRTRLAARLVLECAPIVGKVRAHVARGGDARARARRALVASTAIVACGGAIVGLVRRLRAHHT